MTKPVGRLLAAAGLLLAPVAQGSRLRPSSQNSTGVQSLVSVKREEPDPAADIPTPKEIHEKWDKMDDFLEVMFVMACKWKHGKEVHDKAAHAYKDGQIKGNELEAFKKQTQAQNLVELKAACGNIVARGKGKCRQSCADRWGTAMEDRARCDKKCVDSYASFERDCTGKADSLELVYEMRLKAAAARKTCHEGFCKEFPSVWLKKKEDMKTEADARCEDYCKEDKLKMRCENKWTLEYDGHKIGIESKCHESSKEVQKCFDDKSKTAGTEEETCQTEGKGKCETEETKCKTDGEADKNAKAEEFCKERNSMCLEQVTDRCLKEHKESLETAKKECEDEDKEAIDKCVTDEMETKEKESKDECEKDKKESCPKDCGKKCDTEKLADCLEGLESENDAAEMFCTDFWKLLHSSSQVDPESGEPIVLLGPANATVDRSGAH